MADGFKKTATKKTANKTTKMFGGSGVLGPFEEALIKGIYSGQAPGKNIAAREWFRNYAKASMSNVKEGDILGMTHRATGTIPKIGSMYFYRYDPKHKQTLPYYDEFPVVIPIAPMQGGFLAINFHYLHPAPRAKLMDALYSIRNNKNMDDTTRVQASYAILKAASKYRFFQPALKHYLFSHVQSKFIQIHPAEWDMAIFLDLAQFKKATQSQVWADSKKVYGK